MHLTLKAIRGKASLALALLTVGGLAGPAAHAQTLTLGQNGSTTLSGTTTLTDTGTNAAGTYTYDDGGTGTPLASQNNYGEWDAYGPSTANVSGGYVRVVFTYDTSTANVSGGSTSRLQTFGTSVLDLFGMGFSETFVGSGSGYTQYDVMGTLLNGDPLNAEYDDYGGTLEFNGVAAVPTSPVPEASSVVSLGLLLLLGLGGIAVSRKRKAGAAG